MLNQHLNVLLNIVYLEKKKKKKKKKTNKIKTLVMLREK